MPKFQVEITATAQSDIQEMSHPSGVIHSARLLNLEIFEK